MSWHGRAVVGVLLLGASSIMSSGAGIGVNWVETNNFVVKAFFAHKVGNAQATSAPDSMNRFWIHAVKYF